MKELENFLKESLFFQFSLGVNDIFDFTTGRSFSFKKKENNENSNQNFKKEQDEEDSKDIIDIKTIDSDNIQNQTNEHTNNDILYELTNKLSEINNFDDLVESIKKDCKCDIKKYAKNDVIFDGYKEAKIMLIGEAPGANEDLEGKPFCGQSGKLLRTALSYINLNTDNMLITNNVFWRPPENRKPTDIELQVCKPFLLKMIEIVKPKIIILCGSTATNNLLEIEARMNQIAGTTNIKTFSFNNSSEKIMLFPVFHPSFLLRQPSMKKIFWKHLLILQENIKQLGCIE